MGIAEIRYWDVAIAYGMLLVPIALVLWLRAPILSDMLWSFVRMTIQLILVGVFLRFLFDINHFWLNALWLLIIMAVADASIYRGCGLRMRRFALPLYLALIPGTLGPLLYFMGPVLGADHLLDARYAIPIGGMVLGNCLTANIVGIRSFYETIYRSEKAFRHTLAQGARLNEATRPYLRDAVTAAMAPTVARTATIGIVALPGMMTGVILGQGDPLMAIRYQICIMIAIVTGTTITVYLAIRLTIHNSFNAYGLLDPAIFTRLPGEGKKR